MAGSSQWARVIVGPRFSQGRVGVFSSRKLEKRLVEDVAFHVLAAGNEPDFRTISEFRRSHLKTLEGPFEQLLRLASLKLYRA